MIVSEQLNYIKTRRFHAIFMPVLIEFSRCIGTYSSAKFEYISKITLLGEYHTIVNDIRNFVFGLAEAAVYGSCKSRKQKFVKSFTITIQN